MSGTTESGIPLDIYEEVLERDDYQCQCCGSENDLTVHHVKYRSQGGGHDKDNLLLACLRCHDLIHLGKLKVIRINNHWFFGGSARRRILYE